MQHLKSRAGGSEAVQKYLNKHKHNHLHFRIKYTVNQYIAECFESCELLRHRNGRKPNYIWNQQLEYYTFRNPCACREGICPVR